MPHASRKARIVGRMVRCDLSGYDELDVLVMGDLHIGDSHADEDMIRSAVKWLNEADNRRAVIVGDLVNAALKTSVSDVYSEAYDLDTSLDVFARIISPARDKVLAAISGNHDHRVHKEVGMDAARVACERAGIPYFGGEAYLNLAVGNYQHKGSERCPVMYSGYITHGFGGGRMVGGKANNLLRLRDIVAADWYASGHTHQPLIIPEVVWECDSQRGNIIERQQMFVATGASLDRGKGYAVRFGFAALPKCWPIITFNGRYKRMSARVA